MIYASQTISRILCPHWGGEGHVLRSLANKCEQDYELPLNLIVKRLKDLRGFTWKKERWWKGDGEQFWHLSYEVY